VYLTSTAPSRLADELIRHGHTVYEALAVSEVLHLCEHHDIDIVIIAPEIDDPELVEVQLRRPTMKLKPRATVGDVLWELEQLFPSPRPVQ
jgi:hypothetical protein